MAFKYEKEDIKLAKLLLKGYILEKTVRQATGSSGAIYVPKRWIGKTFKVILIEKDEFEGLI